MQLNEVSAKTRKFLFSTVLIDHPPQRFAVVFDYLVKVLPFHLIVLLKRLTVSSKYLRKISSQQFLIRANTFFSSEHRLQAKKCWRVAMWLIGDDLPSGYKRLVLKEYFSVVDETLLHSRASHTLTIATHSLALRLDSAEPDTWYFLAKFLNSFGFLNAGFIAREKSITLRKLQEIDGNTSRHVLEPVCSACLECLELNKARDILMNFGHRFRPDKVRDFNFHLHLLTDQNLSLKKAIRLSTSGDDQDFRDLIRGKRISLVGTGSPVDDFGCEIDEADLVFRIKFPGEKYLSANRFHGVRCDIAQYTNLTSMEMIIKDGSQLEFLVDLKAVVVLHDTKTTSIQGVPVFYFDNFSSAYRYSDLTTGMRCLVNLIKSEPASIKLFGFDFYAGKEMYDSNLVNFYEKFGWTMGDPTFLLEDRSKTYSDRVLGFFVHDQIGNFSLARNLYRAGWFQIEPFGAGILDLTPSEYSDRIEGILRNALNADFKIRGQVGL